MTNTYLTYEPGKSPPRAWVDVDLGALVRNARRMADHVAPARLIPMVKADAYGMGAVPVARALERLNPWAFGVAKPAEGTELREAGIERRIIVFTPSASFEGPEIFASNLDAAAPGVTSLRRLAAWAKGMRHRLAVHLEVDTGMGRAGLPAAEAGSWAPEVSTLVSGGDDSGWVSLASVYTHFHSAASDSAATRRQLADLQAAIGHLEEAGVDVPLRHAANSDAAMRPAKYHLDAVRAGIYLYGGRRGGAGRAGHAADAAAKRVLATSEAVAHVRAPILQVRDLPPGSTISYGATYTTKRRESIATLGIGYADGLPWSASNRGSALVHGARVPIRGRVCMDVTAVDVSGMKGVEAGDPATLLGGDRSEEITPEELAQAAGTTEYEVLAGIGRRLPRYYGPVDGTETRKIAIVR